MKWQCHEAWRLWKSLPPVCQSCDLACGLNITSIVSWSQKYLLNLFTAHSISPTLLYAQTFLSSSFAEKAQNVKSWRFLLMPWSHCQTRTWGSCYQRIITKCFTGVNPRKPATLAIGPQHWQGTTIRHVTGNLTFSIWMPFHVIAIKSLLNSVWFETTLGDHLSKVYNRTVEV